MSLNSKKLLYVSSEIAPFSNHTLVSSYVRDLPKLMQANQLDIRIIAPKSGLIHNRSHRLHEVLRLSGNSITIDQQTYYISVKVSTIPNTKLQVYFIDNLSLLTKQKWVLERSAKYFAESDDLRMLFFCASVIEILKKMEWAPDLVHCHDWISVFVPLLWEPLKQTHPAFAGTKFVSTLYNHPFGYISNRLERMAQEVGMNAKEAALLQEGTLRGCIDAMMRYVDSLILAEELVDPDMNRLLDTYTHTFLPYSEQCAQTHLEIYQRLL